MSRDGLLSLRPCPSLPQCTVCVRRFSLGDDRYKGSTLLLRDADPGYASNFTNTFTQESRVRATDTKKYFRRVYQSDSHVYGL